MAEYYINNTPISQFGIIPTKANGNIAISGCFNLPKRKGTTYYDWVTDNSVEPYVDSGDMVFDSREISITGNIVSDSDSFLSAINDFINGLPELFTLSCKWGSWSVKYKSTTIETFTKSACKVTIKFTEPLVNLSGTLPSPTENGDIDGYKWTSFGLYLKEISNYQGIGAPKSLSVTQNSSYSLSSKGGIEKTEITVSGIIIAENVEQFKKRIKSLYALLGKDGIRIINYRGREIKCFCTNGFSVQNVFSIGEVYAEFSCKLIVVSNERIQDIQE